MRKNGLRHTSGLAIGSVFMTELIVKKASKGNWNVVHSFIAREPKHHWSDPLDRDVPAAFYRIREGR